MMMHVMQADRTQTRAITLMMMPERKIKLPTLMVVIVVVIVVVVTNHK